MIGRVKLIATFASALAFAAQPMNAQEIIFAHQVMTILKKHCAKCHAGDKKQGGLAMNTRDELIAGGESGEVVAPGDASISRLIEVVESDDDGERMPPEGPPVSAEKIAILRKWIDAKLPWETGITLGPRIVIQLSTRLRSRRACRSTRSLAHSMRSTRRLTTSRSPRDLRTSPKSWIAEH